jgi:hypothetical protein
LSSRHLIYMCLISCIYLLYLLSCSVCFDFQSLPNKASDDYGQFCCSKCLPRCRTGDFLLLVLICSIRPDHGLQRVPWRHRAGKLTSIIIIIIIIIIIQLICTYSLLWYTCAGQPSCLHVPCRSPTIYPMGTPVPCFWPLCLSSPGATVWLSFPPWNAVDGSLDLAADAAALGAPDPTAQDQPPFLHLVVSSCFRAASLQSTR